MNPEKPDLRERTKAFAVRIIRLFKALPRSVEVQVVGKQLLRSGTSVGAHYREAQRARSAQEFVSKLHLGLQELEETRYWLEILGDSDIVSSARLRMLLQEAGELAAIFTASSKTARKRAK